MGSDNDPRVLGVLLGIVALLYLASWLIAGPPPGWQGASEAGPGGLAHLEESRQLP